MRLRRTITIATDVIALTIFCLVVPYTLSCDIVELCLYASGVSYRRRLLVVNLYRYACLFCIFSYATLVIQPSLMQFVGWVRVAYEELNSSQMFVSCSGPNSLLGDVLIGCCCAAHVGIRVVSICTRVVDFAFSTFPACSIVCIVCMHLSSSRL